MFSKILVANRGEIACRIIQTINKMGIESMAVFSDADANSKHTALADTAVNIGPSKVDQSYLRGDIIIQAALREGADAIHPGYGFLSENSDFVKAVETAGLTFIGPSSSSIELMGFKDKAKKLMSQSKVPVVPGYNGFKQDDKVLAVEADKIGYPIMIKAIAGGGGTYNNNSNYFNSFCLAQGTYTFQSIDSYGDGWNGGSYSVKDCNNAIIANNTNPSGSGQTETFTVANCGSIPGCTNFEATNYNPLANEDDGSCLISGCTDYNAANYNPEANEDDGHCILYGCTDATAINYNDQATTEDNTCEYVQVPDIFNFELTGANHTIVLPIDMQFNLLNEPLSNSDIIGVFYNDQNGIEHCAGYVIWQGTTNTIAAQGDDSTTDEIDGFLVGETFTVKVWNQSEDLYYNCVVNYLQSMPNQGEYSTNGISAITDGSAIPPLTSQQIDFTEGWSLFATYLVLENMDIADALSPIYESVVIAKNAAGLAYLAGWDFNGIGDLVYGEGYQIKVSQNASLELNGTYNSPELAQVTLTEGWNIFGYLRTQQADCIAVLESIISEVEIVKNSVGSAYLPSWGFNAIGDLKPSEGYQIKMNNTAILEFNSNSQAY